jgi:hypothetical protein
VSRERLVAACWADLDDAAARGALADYLREAGDPAAATAMTGPGEWAVVDGILAWVGRDEAGIVAAGRPDPPPVVDCGVCRQVDTPQAVRFDVEPHRWVCFKCVKLLQAVVNRREADRAEAALLNPALGEPHEPETPRGDPGRPA